MKNKKIKNGFMLIELLVVILIIGILAAIALPQYQLAVDKATFASYQSTAVSLRDAYNDYVLIHDEGTKDFKDLSFSLPGDFEVSSPLYAFDCMTNATMFCCLSDAASSHMAAIMCGKKDLSFMYAENFLNKSNEPSKRSAKCKAAKDNNRAHRLCRSIGKAGESSDNNAWTPKGLVGGYTNYILN